MKTVQSVEQRRAQATSDVAKEAQASEADVELQKSIRLNSIDFSPQSNISARPQRHSTRLAMSVSSLFPSAQRLACEVQQELSQYESSMLSPQQQVQIEASAATHLQQLSRLLLECDQAAVHEGQRRDMWRQRIKLMQDECQMLTSAYERRYRAVKQQRSALQMRDELLEGRTRNTLDQRPNMSAVDHLSTQHSSLQRSSDLVSEYAEMGRSALTSIRNQRVTMKSAQRRALDVASLLGLSSSLLKVIERSEKYTAAITYGCMCLTLMIVIATWYYVR